MKRFHPRLRIILPLAILLAILLVPLPMKMKDGGTTVYQAVLYRVIDWHRIDDTAPNGYRTGMTFQIIPYNFSSIDELSPP